MSEIDTVTHMSPEPVGGYLSSSPVKVVMLDGRLIHMQWGSPEVRAWRDLNEDEAVAYVAPPIPIPSVISDRQFAHALWKSDLITFDEAMAFVQTGTIPAAIAAGIAAIPDETQRKDTQLLVAGATEYRRDNAAVAALATVLGWTGAQIDAIWTLGASL